MSESELSDAPSTSTPPDFELENSLRTEVRKAAKAGDEYSVTSIRTASEESLGLPAGFFAGHEQWKTRSKNIIKDQAGKDNDISDVEAKSVDKKTKATPKTAPRPKAPVVKPPAKRTSPNENTRPRKKPKTASSEDDLSDPSSDFDEVDQDSDDNRKKSSKPVAKKAQASKSRPKARPKSKDQAMEADEHEEENSVAQERPLDSESELSDVIDDQPAKKSRSKSKDSGESKSKPSKAGKPKSTADADPDQEEIKKLQSWLVKCGIRKVWGKELKPYETSKAKMKHLREMLAEAGMTGRYSNEKAAQIKESRELAADIEAVQEGNERWGKSGDEGEGAGDDDDGTKTRGGRRLVRGAKNYDFLSSDGEETD